MLKATAVRTTRLTGLSKAGGPLKVTAHHLTKLVREVRQISRFAGARASLSYLCAIARHHREIVRSGRLTAADSEMSDQSYVMRVLGTTIITPGSCFGLARELYG